jgi:hypothetical protein
MNAIRWDYPPHGAAGKGAFLITYHSSGRSPTSWPGGAVQTFTLMTITKRRR